MAKKTSEMIDIKTMFTQDDRKVQDVQSYIRNFVEEVIGLEKSENRSSYGMNLDQIRIGSLRKGRHDAWSYWTPTHITGIKLTIDNAEGKTVIRKIMAKNGKINKTDLITKYNELKELVKTEGEKRDNENKRINSVGRERVNLIKETGFQPTTYGNVEPAHGLKSVYSEQLGSIQLKMEVPLELAKEVMILLRERMTK